MYFENVAYFESRGMDQLSPLNILLYAALRLVSRASRRFKTLQAKNSEDQIRSKER